ncbi:uncharacterized protein LOC114244561 [Bombyx mandarina]|uniref:Uncharacterized protein n=2 Tax=Bombyx TaxID=7090 RepID=A0A8R2QTA1_BOMMO|nr:uncharacterized protein LOC114244561 [Bombyx mandarina]XP_037867452.1 uncharacterized protein LOC101742576 isoform X2 [Bombyx mori]
MYNFMSGDSEPYKKREQEVGLLLPERSKGPAPVTSSTSVAVADAALDTKDLENIDENQEFIKSDKDAKDGRGDANEKYSENSDDYLENKELHNKSPEAKYEKESGDKVDSVYLRPSQQKTLSPPIEEEEDCGIKCLYYTLQCCDCVLM